MRRLYLWGIGVLVVALVAWGTSTLVANPAYSVQLVMPSAANLVTGSRVQIKGVDVGEVEDLSTRSGRAIVNVSVSGQHAPLHSGTTARVVWSSALGERVVELDPGPASNPKLPEGALLQARPTHVEVDDLLAALDAPTREKLKSLVAGLDRTMAGHEDKLNETLKTAGPAVGALGQVLEGVGRDGPAIRALVTRLHAMAGPLAQRQEQLREIVTTAERFTGATAQRQRQLAEGLRQVPATLDAANSALKRVPKAADASIPLLNDLQPATRRLPSVAHNLSPLLVDLRPAAARLRPVLKATRSVLQNTPTMLDMSHGVLPSMTRTFDKSAPAVRFLRPYTPELIGWLSNWGNAFSTYDAQGNLAHVLLTASSASLNNNPGVKPPGIQHDLRPPPGAAEGQPWTDANGDGIR